MIRRTLRAAVVCLSLLSLLCCAATAALWVRSCVKPEAWERQRVVGTPARYTFRSGFIASDHGHVYVSNLVENYTDWTASPTFPKIHASATGRWTYRPGARLVRDWMELRTVFGYGRSDLGRIRERRMEDSARTLNDLDARRREAWDWQRALDGDRLRRLHPYSATGYVVCIPLWPLSLVTLIGSVPLVWRFARRFHRAVTPGQCRKCGYDLRGSPSGRCPECGTAMLTYRELTRVYLSGRRHERST